ncbi:hypothetical protein MAR_022548 [Mya arenaria]|uniref:Uncharacterized protein n=1 Tax=Mya arenaria TaxID=6604 RepID=A0ABY7DNA9_MYAAR|nr:uncharacterized protein LOC128228321 [Mya arenaria]WAQ98175.1 hypothetical protein MAR_022548 [Mya arenaria]
MIAFSEIIKNAFTFSNIVSQAFGEEVRAWNEKSVQNALSWAHYCMKVAEETKGCSYRSDLDRHIQGLTILLNPVSLLHLDLNLLTKAPSILTKILLKNPHLPRHLSAVVQSNGSPEYSQVPLDVLPVYRVLCSEELAIQGCVRDQGQHVLDRLVFLHGLTNSSHRFEKFIDRLIADLSSLPNCQDIILCTLLAEVKNNNGYEAAVNLKERISSLMFEKHMSALYSCGVTLVCSACALDDQFCTKYLEFLQHWGDSMKPQYGLTQEGQLYCWRYEQTDLELNRSFKRLATLISALQNKNKKTRLKVSEMMKDSSKRTFVNVWKDMEHKCIA